MKLHKLVEPLASFDGSASRHTKLDMNDHTNETYMKSNEFVAIAEGIHLPFYIFTYNVEMTQFISTDLAREPDQTELIDKTIPARHHAQFIANQIADEGRLNNHNHGKNLTECLERLQDKLIRNYKIVQVEYPAEVGNPDIEYPLPEGLQK